MLYTTIRFKKKETTWWCLGIILLLCFGIFADTDKVLHSKSFSVFDLGLNKSNYSKRDQDILTNCSPGPHFLSMLRIHVNKSSSDIIVIDIDMKSVPLFHNAVESIRLLSCNITVVAIAYEDNVCDPVLSQRTENKRLLLCFYDHDWIGRLEKHGQIYKLTHRIQIIMFGRVAITTFSLFAGYNVFLLDADVVFFRNPYEYIPLTMDIVVIAESCNRWLVYPHGWGGFFIQDRPSLGITLNNGIVFYRSNDRIKQFSVDLQLASTNALKNYSYFKNSTHTRLNYWEFLQVEFNSIMAAKNLKLTQFNNTDCFDCFYGNISMNGDGSVPYKINISTFPRTRFVSFCTGYDWNYLPRRHGNTLQLFGENITADMWQWNHKADSTQQTILFVHANCLPHNANWKSNRSKIDVLKSIGAWYL